MLRLLGLTSFEICTFLLASEMLMHSVPKSCIGVSWHGFQITAPVWMVTNVLCVSESLLLCISFCRMSYLQSISAHSAGNMKYVSAEKTVSHRSTAAAYVLLE